MGLISIPFTEPFKREIPYPQTGALKIRSRQSRKKLSFGFIYFKKIACSSNVRFMFQLGIEIPLYFI